MVCVYYKTETALNASMVTSHQRPDSRVVRPSRESNPVHPLSHGEAVIQTVAPPKNGCEMA
jgi:hypothetical protein